MKSTTSVGSNNEEVDELNDDDDDMENEKCCHKPFVFRIIKYNLPEINWIILGCVTSILFGALTPVS